MRWPQTRPAHASFSPLSPAPGPESQGIGASRLGHAGLLSPSSCWGQGSGRRVTRPHINSLLPPPPPQSSPHDLVLRTFWLTQKWVASPSQPCLSRRGDEAVWALGLFENIRASSGEPALGLRRIHGGEVCSGLLPTYSGDGGFSLMGSFPSRSTTAV